MHLRVLLSLVEKFKRMSLLHSEALCSDFYRYPSDVYQTNDYDDGVAYPPACDGPFSGRYTPMKEGRGTPLRRSNTVVLGSRPTSRINLGTQVNTFVPDTPVIVTPFLALIYSLLKFLILHLT